MDENELIGSAKPALAAHSKDASAPGQTPMSSATGDAGATTEMGGDKVRASVEAMTSSAREMAGNVRQTLSDQSGRAADQATEFVRAQPLIALSVTGAICFAFGVLLGRR